MNFYVDHIRGADTRTRLVGPQEEMDHLKTLAFQFHIIVRLAGKVAARVLHLVGD
jgi:hypothetical protein